MSVPTVAVTGANGFLGAEIVRELLAQNFKVLALVRDPTKFELTDASLVVGKFSLASGLEGSIDASAIDVLIHCAHDFSSDRSRFEDDPNICGSKLLFENFNSAKKIYISSMSASADAESRYGKSKFAIEKLLSSDDCVVRPGFIVGPGGICSRLRNQLLSLPFHPLFYWGRQTIQIVALSDLIAAVMKLVKSDLRGELNVAFQNSYPIAEFYRALIGSHTRKFRPLPLPGLPFLYLFYLLERLRIKLPLGSENLLGLKRLARFETTESEKSLGLTYKSLPLALLEASAYGVPSSRRSSS